MGAYAIQDLLGNRYAIEVTPPSGYLVVAPEYVTRPSSGDLEVNVDFSLPFHLPTEGTVTTIPAGRLIRKSANFFDLEGTTLTFTPEAAGRYTVAVGGRTWEEPGRVPEGALSAVVRREKYLSVDLPFPFAFAGRKWMRIYANANGHISLQRPERMNWPERDPWADAGMRSVAAAIDSRSATGLETMIAVLYALHGDTTISVASTPTRVVITWRGVRALGSNTGYAPLGENLFQARLYPSGVIELAYRAVPERDGIVGLFHGMDAHGPILDSVDDRIGDSAYGVVDIVSAELVDNGSTMLARLTLAEDVPERVGRSEITYGVRLEFSDGSGDASCNAEVRVTGGGHRGVADWCNLQPAVVGYRVHGTTVEVHVSKTLLNGAGRFSWHAYAVWWGRDHDDTRRRTVHVGEPDYDVGTMAGSVGGNVFEVFHYPLLRKRIETVLSFIYEQAPANDEIAVTFTDFRMDDLFSTGGGTGAVNAAVQGIGEEQANPSDGADYGSDNLLTSMMPVFLGAPNWAESGFHDDYAFRSFAKGIRWVAHEAVHGWGVDLQFRNPRSGEVEDLADRYGHWSHYLHAPAAHPVWPGYASASYSESSVMGGEVWVDNGDGTFTRNEDGNPLPTGLSALDLYVMGMIPPTEVPDTFLLTDVQETSTWWTVRATKVPVRIGDVLAAMGPRVPAADMSRKEFRLGVYLLHEDGRPPRVESVGRARAVSTAIAEYFARATGGRMHVVPSSRSSR